MNRRTFSLTGAAALLLLSGCVGTPGRPRDSGHDLAGRWTFTVNTGRSVVQGAMTLVADGVQYQGTLTTDQGDNVLKVRSMILNGTELAMTVDSPQGVVTFKGVLNADARSFDGVVTYHNGQSFPMSGVKR